MKIDLEEQQPRPCFPYSSTVQECVRPIYISVGLLHVKSCRRRRVSI